MRLSYGKNPFTNGLEILEENDYYPFGMNYLRTGTSYFGAGSWMNYKYQGQELQETGMYDYGARFYMPDIGIFGQYDPLSEKTMQPLLTLTQIRQQVWKVKIQRKTRSS